MYGKLNSEDRLVLLVARTELNSTQQEELLAIIKNNPDWTKIAENIKNNGISAIFFYNLSRFAPKELIPNEIYNSFQQAYYLNIKRNLLLEVELKKILKKYKELDIKTVLLKGLSMAREVYGNTSIRQSYDIDLLVKEEDVKIAFQSLKELGYKRKRLTYSKITEDIFPIYGKHMPDITNGFNSVDVHVSLFPFLKNSRDIMKLVWNSLTEISYDEYPAYMLSPEFLLVYSCTHLDSHRNDGCFQLKLYCDIAEICKKYQDQLDWQKLIDIYEQYSIFLTTAKHICLAGLFLDAPVPEDFNSYIQLKLKFDPKAETENFLKEMELGKNVQPPGNIKANRLFAGITSLPDLKSKLKFIIGILFPSRAFIVERYQIRRKRYYFLYYFRRLADAVKLLIASRSYDKK